MPEDVKPVGTLKPYDPNSAGTPKPVGKLRPYGGTPLINDFISNEIEAPKRTADQILDGVQTDNDNERQMLKNLALKVNEGKATDADLVDAIKTVQGVHSAQGGKKNYYVEEKDGVVMPKPLGTNQTAPKGVTDIFNETSWYEDLGNSLLRGSSKLGTMLAETPAFIYDVAAMPQNFISGLVGGEQVSSGTFKETFDLPDNKVSEYYKEQTQINQDKFNQKYDKGITDYVSNGEYSKAFGLLGNSIVESAPTTIGLAVANAGGVKVVQSILGSGAVFGAGKKDELDEQAPNMDEQAKMGVALSNGLFEGIFEQFGITKLGSITRDALLKDGKEAAYKLALDGFKQTYRPVITKYLGTSAEESLSEAATQFAQNAVDKYSGYKPDMNLSDGVVDAAIVGFGAGAGYGLLAGKTTEEVQKQKVERVNAQSKKLFDIVTKGNDAVVGFKSEIFNGVKNGKLTQSEADNAITKINAFKDYNDMLGSLELNDQSKRQLFDYSFQKQALETEIAGIKNPEKLNPIEQAQYNVKEKFATDLQKQINEIVLKAQVQDETVLSEKTIKDVDKLENPPKKEGEKKSKLNPVSQAIADKYKKDVSKKEDTRSYEQIPMAEYNSGKLNARDIHSKTVSYLEQQPDKKMIGSIIKKPFEYGGKKNETYGVQLPDGKILRFSSSMKRDEGFRGHMRQEHLVTDEELEGFPVGLKVEEIPSFEEGKPVKKVIKAFNAKTGKFVGYMKETNTGKKQEYNKEQIDYLEHLGTIVETIPPTSGEIIEPTTPIKPPTEQLQKQKVSKGIVEVEHHENVLKVTKHIQKVLPKIKVIYDAKLKVAGKLSADGKTISINPYYAGLDTPIHEGGHVLIDAMGYNNPTIQSAVKQLRNTDLYKETAKRYPELKAEMLDKEVLAEAIGREGAGIFDVEVKKNAFIKLLDKIYEWFKGKLGLDKNLAKSLAKQLIRGEYKNTEPINTGVEQSQVIGIEGAENLGKEVQGALDLAIKMFNTQRDAKQIKAATGWEYDFTDKKWKYETDDSKMTIKGNLKEISDYLKQEGKTKTKLKLGEFVSNFETLKAYPEFKDVTINFYRDNNLSNIASYDANKKQLNININTELNDRGTKKIITHELQHAIQLREGFARGGNFATTYSKVVKRMAQEKGKSINELSKSETQQAANESDRLYHLSAGEVEARNVENRLDKTAEERRNSLLYETEDLIRGEDKIYSYTGSVFNKQEFDELQKDLSIIEEQLEAEQDEEAIAELEAVRDIILENIEELKQENENIKNGVATINNAANTDFDNLSTDELIKVYNDAKGYGQYIEDKEKLDIVREKIGAFLNKQRIDRGGKWKSKIEAEANKRDLKWKEVIFRTLGHMTHEFPALQELSQIFDESFMDMEIERNSLKSRHQSDAKEVIKEVNKQNGVRDWAKGIASSNSARYFDYVEKDGRLLTIAEAKQQNLSPAKIKYLETVREIVKERNKFLNKEFDEDNLEIVKIDKGFQETFKDEGFLSALSNYMGGGNNTDIKVTYTNPTTKKEETVDYIDAQKSIISHYKADKTKYPIALAKLLSLAYKAKKAGGRSVYNVDYKGLLTSKFDTEERLKNEIKGLETKLSDETEKSKIKFLEDKIKDSKNKLNNFKTKSYSKDFYSATNQMIDDFTHIKHMSKFVALTDSLELFYDKLGRDQEQQFGATKEFLSNWRDLFVYQKYKQTDPILDSMLNSLRSLTSKTVMAFNPKANTLNVIIGNYNNLRKESLEHILKGNLRLKGKGAGFNKYALDLADRYAVVSLDFDGNPKVHAGKLWDFLAFGLQRWGEKQIQISQWLGYLTDEEWNSFEYKDDKLVPKKGVDEKALKKKFIQYKNKVSDVQGKYGEKDRRGYMMWEYGKTLGQFKTFAPDWWKERFGKEYIDSNNEIHRGSWNTFTKQAISDIKKDISEKGYVKAFWENKDVMANIKGLMFVAVMLAWKYSDDDEERKKKKAELLNNAIGQMFFVFDPHQLKYTVVNPPAAIGTLGKIIDITADLMEGEGAKAVKDIKKVTPYGKGIYPAIDVVTK